MAYALFGQIDYLSPGSTQLVAVASGCANTDNAQSEYTDNITTNCNSVGGSCGYSIDWTWHWCGPSAQLSPVGHLSGYVHNDAIRVNGRTTPPNSNVHPPGTVISP